MVKFQDDQSLYLNNCFWTIQILVVSPDIISSIAQFSRLFVDYYSDEWATDQPG